MEGKVAFVENGIPYEEVDGYFFPMFELEEPKPIGKYGMMRKRFLMEHRKPQYQCMLLQGELISHLAEVDEMAFQMMERLTGLMAKKEGVTEELKARDQMAWVRMMNNIRSRAEEVVLDELVYN